MGLILHGNIYFRNEIVGDSIHMVRAICQTTAGIVEKLQRQK